MSSIEHLIAEARGLANDHPCTRGHQWEFLGGRFCDECGGSKDVYTCAICGDCDYGDREVCGSECDLAKEQYEENK